MNIVLICIGVLILVAIMIFAFVFFKDLKERKKQTTNLKEQNSDSQFITPLLNGMAKVEDVKNSKELLSQQISSVNQALDQYKLDLKSSIQNLDNKSHASTVKTSEYLSSLLEKVENLQKDLNGKNASLTTNLDGQKHQINNQFQNVFNLLTTINEVSSGISKDLQEKNQGLNLNLKSQQLKVDQDFQKVFDSLTDIKNSAQTIPNIQSSLQNLQDIFLNNNKARGNFGELVLDKMLTEVYGTNKEIWEPQYKLPNNTIVDALVKTPSANQENIAIDSKFPFTNYNNYLSAEDKASRDHYAKLFVNDFKTRINEAKKFIDAKNNISSVIMFVPSEEVFLFVHKNYQQEIINPAFQNRVYITSPTSLMATLFLLEKQIKDYKLNTNLDKIKKNITDIMDQFGNWHTRWDTLNKDIVKISEDTRKLNITHDKIYRKYELIEKDPSIKSIEEVSPINESTSAAIIES